MSTNASWVATRRELNSNIRNQVRRLVGEDPRDLAEYRQKFAEQFALRWRRSSWDVLVEAINRSQLVLGGEFHAHRQSQQAYVRLFRLLPPETRWVFGFECFRVSDQAKLDAFMSYDVSAQELLDEVRWSETWGFPAEGYLAILDLVRQRGFIARALSDSRQGRLDLGDQDSRAAITIGQWVKEWPQHKIFVLIGNLHLAPAHLPLAIEQQLPKIRPLSIIQNAEELYFRLAERGLEHEVEVLARDRKNFCIITTPPWVQWQSYLLHLESDLDADSDVGLDYTDYIAAQIEFVCRELKWLITAHDILVFSATSNGLWRLMRKHYKGAELKALSDWIRRGRSCYLPEAGILYLARPSVNHAAGLVGQYLHKQLSGREKSFLRQPRFFYGQIWIEALGFFVSKLINHRRKAAQMQYLVEDLSRRQPDQLGHEVWRLVLEQRMVEAWYHQRNQVRKLNRKSRSLVVYWEAAEILGTMLGEKIYQAFHGGLIDNNQLKSWFEVDCEKDFDRKYLMLVSEVDDILERRSRR